MPDKHFALSRQIRQVVCWEKKACLEQSCLTPAMPDHESQTQPVGCKTGSPKWDATLNVRSCNPQDRLSLMHSKGENKRRCSKLIQGGWINTLRKRWQQAISLNAAGTPRWREIKQVFVRTQPSLLTLPGRISGISCSHFSNKRDWQQSAAVFAYAQTLTPGHLQDLSCFQSPAWRGRNMGTRGCAPYV